MQRILFSMLVTWFLIGFPWTGTPSGMSGLPDHASSYPDRPPRTRLENAPRLPAVAERTIQNTPVLTPGTAPWTYLVYQSLRDDNWEIYLSALDGSQDVRLTDHPALDVQPRLNRGASQVAFVSDRDEDEEIFIVNTDGSGLTQLTINEEIIDGDPAWSPDGKRIAFTSNRDGSFQIYLMNADGSNQIPLTTDPNSPASQPAWSPDGSQIAYTTNYSIWVMNADGSSQHKVSLQAYSENPAWAPDGRRIAYDADYDGDGFMELWVMASNGSTQDLVYDHYNTMADTWMGSWSPDGRYLAFTSIFWTVYNGQWYWTDAYVWAYDTYGLGDPVYLTNGGVEASPDWQPTDTTPPASNVQSMPRYSRSYTTLQMSGSDGDGIGLLGFDIQYQDSSQDDWVDWLTETPQNFALFAGMPGRAYNFRVRAKDYFYNTQAWPLGDGNTQTTLYSWGVSGKVMDSAGFPVANAGLTTVPAELTDASSDYLGNYVAYVGQAASNYTTLWGKLGYSPLPSSYFPPNPDANQDIYFPPLDDLVMDGGFESGALAPNWRVTGTITSTTSFSMPHTGIYAAQLGIPGDPMAFITPTLMSNPAAVSAAPQVALCPDGSAQIIWEDNGAIVHLARTGDGTGFGAKTKVSASVGGTNPQIVCDTSNGLHSAWVSNQGAYYAFKPADGAWSPPKKVSGALQVDFPPRLAVNLDDYVHIMWGGDGVWYAGGIPDGTWSPPLEVPYWSYMDEGNINDLQLAIGLDGALHAMWAADGWSGYFSVFYGYRSSLGFWQSEEINTSYGHALDPQLAVGLDGVAHVVWVSDFVIHRQRSLDGVWSEPQEISWPDRGERPFISIGPDGLAYAVFNVYGETLFTRQQPGGAWLYPQEVPGAGQAYSAYIGVDAGGNVNLIYQSDRVYAMRQNPVSFTWSAPIDISKTGASGDSLSATSSVSQTGSRIHGAWVDNFGKVQYAGPPGAEESGESAITQKISLPQGLHKPVFSLLYSLEGGSNQSDNYFSLAITESITPSVVFTASTQSGWEHYTMDASPWVGKEITLTLSAHQGQGAYPFIAMLDEVSLGSWLTPVIYSASPQPVPANQSVDVTIAGQNFIDPVIVKIGSRTADTVEWLDESNLIAHFVQGVSPGLQLLQVSNPGKQLALLPMQVGKLVYIPLISR